MLSGAISAGVVASHLHVNSVPTAVVQHQTRRATGISPRCRWLRLGPLLHRRLDNPSPTSTVTRKSSRVFRDRQRRAPTWILDGDVPVRIPYVTGGRPRRLPSIAALRCRRRHRRSSPRRQGSSASSDEHGDEHVGGRGTIRLAYRPGGSRRTPSPASRRRGEGLLCSCDEDPSSPPRVAAA